VPELAEAMPLLAVATPYSLANPSLFNFFPAQEPMYKVEDNTTFILF
jgi:hypothetical protein